MADKLIRLYGAGWCPDTARAKTILAVNHVLYSWFDVDEDKAARGYVESVNDGDCRIPTIVFTDGSILVEPENEELEKKLGL